MQRAHVHELDGLRAILALWVVACHMLSWSGFYDVTFPGQLELLWSEFIGGRAAVETFMILSGFAISFLLNGRPQSYLEFMTGRFFRIYPIYLICLAVGVASTYLVPYILQTAQWKSTIYFEFEHGHYLAERANMGAHLLWHATLLNGLIPKHVLPDSAVTFLPPAWSITLEWQYYLIAPILARMVRSAPGILCLALLSVIGHHYFPHSNSFLLFQLPLFLIGIGSYHLYEWFSLSGHTRSPLFALPAMALLTFAILSGWHRVALAIWAVVFGCIFIRGNDSASRMFSGVRGMLLHSWLQQLGRMSYCIYLIHWPLILALLYIFLHWQPTLSSYSMVGLLALIGVPLIIVASTILHEYAELPAMKYGKKLGHSFKEKSNTKIAE